MKDYEGNPLYPRISRTTGAGSKPQGVPFKEGRHNIPAAEQTILGLVMILTNSEIEHEKVPADVRIAAAQEWQQRREKLSTADVQWAQSEGITVEEASRADHEAMTLLVSL